MSRKNQRGVAMIEFALVGFILIMLIFGGIEYGRLMSNRQFCGEGARIAAKEASTKPGALVLPPNAANLFIDPDVFDERFTVIDLNSFRFPSGAVLTDQDGDGDVDLDDQFRVLPAVHTTLRVNMATDNRTIAGVPRRLFRFRGVLLRNPGAAPFDLVVRVPDFRTNPAFLRRIIHPPLPTDPQLTGQGLVRIECWQWFDFAAWPFGGSGLPAVAYTNFPPGYATVITTDIDAGTRQARSLRSFSIARKEIQ